MERRNTIQRRLVLDTVRKLKCHATADEVYLAIAAEYPNIGKGTVYRNLNILAEDGEIKKVEIPNGPDRFDHTLRRHYHIRCVKCGRVEDVEMSKNPLIEDSVVDTHGFEMLNFDILFKGICLECKGN